MAESVSLQRTKMLPTIFPQESGKTKTLHVLKVGDEEKAVVVYSRKPFKAKINKESETLPNFYNLFSYGTYPCSNDHWKKLGDQLRAYFVYASPPLSAEEKLSQLEKKVSFVQIGCYKIKALKPRKLSGRSFQFKKSTGDRSYVIKFQSPRSLHSARCSLDLDKSNNGSKIRAKIWLHFCKIIDAAIKPLAKKSIEEIIPVYESFVSQTIAHANPRIEGSDPSSIESSTPGDSHPLNTSTEEFLTMLTWKRENPQFLYPFSSSPRSPSLSKSTSFTRPDLRTELQNLIKKHQEAQKLINDNLNDLDFQFSEIGITHLTNCINLVKLSQEVMEFIPDLLIANSSHFKISLTSNGNVSASFTDKKRERPASLSQEKKKKRSRH